MKKALGALLVLSLLVPLGVQGQEAPPEELEQFKYFLGDWTYGTEDSPGTMHFEMLGDYFLQVKEYTPSGYEVVHVWGYDPNAEAFKGCRYYSSGYTDCFTGWVDGDKWVWLIDGSLENLRRLTFTQESQTSYTFLWERSVKGGPWETRGGGTATKVK